ncbi:hypothetical protein [Frigoriflavimonas asaccharolytica]|uniref:Uncharacterized protein n=1 Tax=Frigoriflavimonas asaccharolytica TaxID=2735899 RepID=A0A8J8K644_9FLAO|nr:hypothetical protein [Frigoriflavimonas asaccharolytica]NRS93330.1 hypothetical protein [Frigoriflavimonas asaccharolytica]
MKKLFFVAALGVAGMMSASNTIVKEVEIAKTNECIDQKSAEISPLKLKSPGDVIIEFDLSCCTGATWPVQNGTAINKKQLDIIEAILESVYCDE